MFTRIIALCCFLLSLVFYSCKKNSSGDIVPNPPQASLVGNFSVLVTDRQPTEAVIKWTKPTFPAGSTLQYKIYLGGTLLQNVSDTNYTFPGLSANQVYQGRVVAYISATDSSKADFTIAAFVPGNPADSVSILTNVGNSSGMALSLTYDIVNKRYSSWQETYSSYYDSTVVWYNTAGIPVSMIRKTPSTNATVRLTPHVFEYANNRVQKIYHKRYKETSPVYQYLLEQYLTTVTFPLTLSDIESYDSLNYSGNNKLISTYNIKIGGIGEPATYIKSYSMISYMPQNDSLLQNIQEYSRTDYISAFTLTNYAFLTYNNKANPYYTLLERFFPFLCSRDNYATKLPTLPHYYFGYATVNRYFIANAYLCTNFNAINDKINFGYNAQGLVNVCWWANDGTEWVGFSYTRYKK